MKKLFSITAILIVLFQLVISNPVNAQFISISFTNPSGINPVTGDSYTANWVVAQYSGQTIVGTHSCQPATQTWYYPVSWPQTQGFSCPVPETNQQIYRLILTSSAYLGYTYYYGATWRSDLMNSTQLASAIFNVSIQLQ